MRTGMSATVAFSSWCPEKIGTYFSHTMAMLVLYQ
jgi:hypothetical protein